MLKTGADHLNSLRDGRTIYLDRSLGLHRRYRASCLSQTPIRSTAHLYHFQATPANLERVTRFLPPTTGERGKMLATAFALYAELVQRREALTSWAETTYSFIGSRARPCGPRVGRPMGLEVFERHSLKGGGAFQDYFTSCP